MVPGDPPLSHTGFSDRSTVAQKKTVPRVYFGVLLGDLILSDCTFLFTLDTRYTVEDIEEALLNQLKASKDTSIAVKKPEDENIRFTNYGNTVWT